MNKENCCLSLEVEGGTFYRMYNPISRGGDILTAPDGGPSSEARPATVSTYRLDKYLVTVGRFRQWLRAVEQDAGAGPALGAGKHTYLNDGGGLLNADYSPGDSSPLDAGAFEPGWVSGYLPAPGKEGLICAGGNPTWTASASGDETLPINCVTWDYAYAFCIWDGGFLPSSAEWEYAAAGGSEQRVFPWGSTDPGAGSTYAIFNCQYKATSPGNPSSCANGGNLAPVGMAPAGAGRWGQLDLAGNVWEYVLDANAVGYTDPCVNCANLGPASRSGPSYMSPAIRGGDFGSPKYELTPSTQDFDQQAVGASPQYGFRCARDPRGQ